MISNNSASSSSTTSVALASEKDLLRKDLATASEQDDPLAPYARLVKWTTENSKTALDENDELIEILEETTRLFRNDPIYRGDLRYLKIWILYAKCTKKPETIYAYLLEKEIGTVYSHLYEEYALVLEKNGRIKDADGMYQLGIKRPCRALDSFKQRYHEFRQRVASGNALQHTEITRSTERKKTKADDYRHNPLKNIVSKSVKEDRSSRMLQPLKDYDPYVHMRAPQNPGKRPEKLRFDLSLVFKNDKESCLEEARARSLGLLGKKWGPPPVTKAKSPIQAEVNFNDDGAKSSNKNLTANVNLTMSMAGEPTVTINTKAALNDVFGMYNSPEKSQNFASIAGSKHAPIKKVSPVQQSTPVNTSEQINAENTQFQTKTQAFRPFVDENARKENFTPAAKFEPFVDEMNGSEPSKTPVITPGTVRRALALKENTTPASNPQKMYTKQERPAVDSLSEDIQTNSVFSRVFTPAGSDMKTIPSSRILQEQGDGMVSIEKKATAFPQTVSTVTKTGAVASETHIPAKVFSRPASQDGENARKTFTPSTISNKEVFSKTTTRREIESQKKLKYDSAIEIQQEVTGSTVESTIHEQDDYDVEQSTADHSAPLNRFGKFSVMTPIMERTFEFTASTKNFGTPSDGSKTTDNVLLQLGANQAAEKLAAEIKEDQEGSQEIASIVPTAGPSKVQLDQDMDQYKDLARYKIEQEGISFSDDLVEKTGTLSLADAILAASSFRPPNPCNPTDPQIISILLSLNPPDTAFHDLRNANISRLKDLQNFALKRGRRSSRDRRNSEGQDGFILRLDNKKYEVVDKLGEGGFGAVFLAKDYSTNRQALDYGDELDEDKDEDDDDEDNSMVAIKIVKPRNIWEYHVLRRIHNSLPQRLKSSVINPYSLYAFRDESYFVMEWCRQGSLLNVVNEAINAGIAQHGGCLDELLVVFFTVELIRFVQGIHAVGIIHGDLKIDNCLLRLEETLGGLSAWSGMYQPSGEGGWKHKGIKMIDFGRTIDTRMFPSDQQYIADWPTDAGNCMEMRENRPWTYQADYFGLAGIIYCMLFGKHMDYSSVISASTTSDVLPRYKLAVPFKRYWQVDIWTQTFDILLNPCIMHADGTLPICDKLAEIRIEMETWLQKNCNRSTNTLKGLLKKVELSVLSTAR